MVGELHCADHPIIRPRSIISIVMIAVGVTMGAARCLLAFSYWLIVCDRQIHVNCAFAIGTQFSEWHQSVN